ncbi:transposase, MuDR, MULE transposase domain protein [Artemisia annua]|uniref:Transposase, MuDR, MULE transposase domain protein n=1 Tax=Artemisia annua TaxID=35608 RepID=A0A2U1KWQ5_ARTAN|nr:transposase, MuDR, MULE transposase domain protein [Artemisia annua]
MEVSKKGRKSKPLCKFPTVFCLKIYHGGAFTSPPKIRYIGGKVNWVDDIDADLFSVVEVSNMMKELGYENAPMAYYYKKPTTDLDNGLTKLDIDKDVLDMLNYVDKYKVMEVYVDHSVSKEPKSVDDGLGISQTNEPKDHDSLGDDDNDVELDVSEDEWLKNTLKKLPRLGQVPNFAIGDMGSVNGPSYSKGPKGGNESKDWKAKEKRRKSAAELADAMEKISQKVDGGSHATNYGAMGSQSTKDGAIGTQASSSRVRVHPSVLHASPSRMTKSSITGRIS